MLVRFASLRPVPWKNGGGITRQIACFPPGSDLDHFDWRISTAEVAADGPFSRFEGIDRRLSILAGAGLALRFEAGATEELRPGAHLDFPGEAAVHGALLDGPVTDLNIMVRRAQQRLQAVPLHVEGTLRRDLPWPRSALFVAAGEVTAEGCQLARYDTLLFEAPARLRVSGSAELLLIGFSPVA